MSTRQLAVGPVIDGRMITARDRNEIFEGPMRPPSLMFVSYFFENLVLYVYLGSCNLKIVLIHFLDFSSECSHYLVCQKLK